MDQQLKIKLKRILHPLMKRTFSYYFSKPRKYRYEGVEVIVRPGIFPPHFTLSTRFFLDHLKYLDLKDKSLLELGCGSGIISLYAASKGARVIATDINAKATEALSQAAIKNNLDITVIHSDLFDRITPDNFDHIIINPPYYPKNPENLEDMAWFCGEGFEYFEKIFVQIQPYLQSGQSLMVLSDDCDLEKINSIAGKNGISLHIVSEKKSFLEKNYIFRLNS